MTPTPEPRRILIVEDNDEDYDTVCTAVQWAGVKAVPFRAITGDECLAFLRNAGSRLPAMVLLDLNLPGMDGRETLLEIKRSKSFRDLPVVVLSTSSGLEDVRDCFAKGANAYHVKPVRHGDHLMLVGTILQYWLESSMSPIDLPLS